MNEKQIQASNTAAAIIHTMQSLDIALKELNKLDADNTMIPEFTKLLRASELLHEVVTEVNKLY